MGVNAEIVFRFLKTFSFYKTRIVAGHWIIPAIKLLTVSAIYCIKNSCCYYVNTLRGHHEQHYKNAAIKITQLPRLKQQ